MRDRRRPAMQGARAFCDSHSPGQRPNLEALVAWQSHAASRTGAGGRLFDAESEDAAAVADMQPVLRPFVPGASRPPPNGRGGVAIIDWDSMDWQPPPSDSDGRCLGGLRLWPLLSDDVEWVDVALSIHRAGHWLALAVEVSEEPDADGELRSRIVLADGVAGALAGLGSSVPALVIAASRAGSACWVWRAAGLGAFVAGLVDLGWPAA